MHVNPYGKLFHDQSVAKSESSSFMIGISPAYTCFMYKWIFIFSEKNKASSDFQSSDCKAFKYLYILHIKLNHVMAMFL